MIDHSPIEQLLNSLRVIARQTVGVALDKNEQPCGNGFEVMVAQEALDRYESARAHPEQVAGDDVEKIEKMVGEAYQLAGWALAEIPTHPMPEKEQTRLLDMLAYDIPDALERLRTAPADARDPVDDTLLAEENSDYRKAEQNTGDEPVSEWKCEHGIPHKQCGSCYDQKKPPKIGFQCETRYIAIEIYDNEIRYDGKTIWVGTKHRTPEQTNKIIEDYKLSVAESGQPGGDK